MFTSFLFFLFTLFNFNISSLLAETVSVTATVEATTSTPPPTTTNSRGYGHTIIPETSSRFSGEAYPNATVTLLKNGVKATTIKANSDGLFSITLEEKYDSTSLYSLFAVDVMGNKSPFVNYGMIIYAGYLTHISGIRLPPTVLTDKIEVIAGDYFSVMGYALPETELQIVIESLNNVNKKEEPTIFTLTSRDTGAYNITLPIVDLSTGDYYVYVKYGNDTRTSKLVKFSVGEENIGSIDSSFRIPGDLNGDGVVDLVDFSILAFWYKKDNPPKYVDLNQDKIVDLTDFSILAFYWTS